MAGPVARRVGDRVRRRLSPEEGYSIVLLGIFAVVVIWTIFYFTGPCEVLDHLPLQDTPGRCLR